MKRYAIILTAIVLTCVFLISSGLTPIHVQAFITKDGPPPIPGELFPHPHTVNPVNPSQSVLNMVAAPTK